MKRFGSALILLSSLTLAACGVTIKPPSHPGPPPPPPAPIVINDPTFPQQCADIWDQELGRPIDPEGLAGCLAQFRRGDSGEAVRAVVRESAEYKARQAAIEEAKKLNGGERGRVRVDGIKFLHEDGSVFRWIGVDGFLDFAEFRRGRDLQPLFVDRLIDARTGQRRPVTLVRVFITLDWRNQEGPQFVGGRGPLVAPAFAGAADPAYLADLVRFVDWWWARGIRLELSFGDLVKIFPAKVDRVALMHQVGAALAQHPAIFGEINEPGHGDQVDADEAQELTQILHGYGWLVANGVYDWPFGTSIAAHGDYAVRHGPRKEDWPRDTRGGDEVRDGFDWKDAAGNVVGHFDGLHVPMVEDEQMGAAEQDDPGRRSANCDDHAQAAASAALFSAGYTFHSNNGVYSQLFEPKQGECATAALTSFAFVHADAQFSSYMRGDRSGGAAVGDMPVIHFDLDQDGRLFTDDGRPCPDCSPARAVRALRTFAKWAHEFVYAVAIRPTVDHFVPRDGFVLDVEFRKGIGRLRRATPLETFFQQLFPVLQLR